jgi:hypothetical protein
VFQQIATTNPGQQYLFEDKTRFLPIQPSDPNGGPVSLTASNLPPGLSFDPTTGVVSGTIRGTAPDADDVPGGTSSAGPHDDVTPDVLIDPPDGKTGKPPDPPDNREE